MKISVIGTGYVGLVAGAMFAKVGNNVVCVDKVEEKVNLLKQGIMPIYEPGLKQIVLDAVDEKLINFTTDINNIKSSKIIFLAVGTPSSDSGEFNLDFIKQAAKDVANAIAGSDDLKVIVIKSTVPPGTSKIIKKIMTESIPENLKASTNFEVVSNPEFLKEGKAVDDFEYPDRIIIGSDNLAASELVAELYEPFSLKKNKIIFMSSVEAELTKLFSNTFLANKVALINEFAEICSSFDADIMNVRNGVCSDRRIGWEFMFPSPGYGGSCLVGEENVLIKENNHVKVMQISDLFKKIDAGFDDIFALSINKDKKLEFKKIKNATKRVYDSSLFSIKTRMNKIITITADHPFIVENKGSFVVKLARDIELGDRLPVFTDYFSDVKFSFDLIDEVIKSKKFDLKKVRIRPIRKMFSSEKIKNVLKGFFKSERLKDVLRSNCMNLKEFLVLEKDLSKFVKRSDLLLFTVKGNPTYSPAVINIDKDFCRLLGYYASEGNLSCDKGLRGTRERIQFHFNSSEKEYISDVIGILKKLNIRTQLINKQKVITIQFSSRIFAYFLRDILKAGVCCYDTVVPELIFSLDKDCRFEFLKGVFRGDGHVAFREDTPAVVYDFGSISKKLIDGMIFLFHSLGIVPSYKTSISKKSSDFAHFLRVSGIDQIKFLQGFKDSQTQKKIEGNFKKYKKFIRQTGFERINNQVSLVKVKEIVQHKPKKNFVYSIEVEDNENFVSSSGLIVHNCFPKDIRGLVYSVNQKNIQPKIVCSIDNSNNEHKSFLAREIKDYLENHGGLSGKTIAVWGLTFKPRTDDMRESAAIDIINFLLENNAKVKANDPKGMDNAKKIFGDKIEYFDAKYDALKDADVLLLLTEWSVYRSPDFEEIKMQLKIPVIFDGRNIFDPERLNQLGFDYIGIGRKYLLEH